MSFCYQENTHFSQAVQCSRENFWGEIKKSSTRWKIESRRSILEAVQNNDGAAIKKWLENEDYPGQEAQREKGGCTKEVL